VGDIKSFGIRYASTKKYLKNAAEIAATRMVRI
jgi:hypothetical protein